MASSNTWIESKTIRYLNGIIVVSFRNHIQHCAMLILCSLLTLILVACEVGGDYTPVATPLPSPSVPAAHLHTYRGQGYSIGYPQNWVVTQASNGSVTFADPYGLAYMVIEVLPNPEGALAARAEVENTLRTNTFHVSSYKRIDISPTIIVGGDTWSQGAATGNINIKDHSTSVAGMMVLLADNHPASSPATNIFVIRYAAAEEIFDVANIAYFEPMLKSFKFV